MTGGRVLVVDDEEPILKIVAYALTREGYQVQIARDACSADRLLSQGVPDLVILDVVLPGKSGIEILRELRTRSDVPIIMLSARADDGDRILGLELGADDYVTKPFSPRDLVARVGARLRRAGRAADQASARLSSRCESPAA